MPPSYRVFIGAPSIHELANDPKAYSWHTTSSTSASRTEDALVMARTQSSRGGVSAKSSMSINTSIGASKNAQRIHNSIQHEQSFVLPKATLEEASRRISLIYRDLVINGAGDEDEDEEPGGGVVDGEEGGRGGGEREKEEGDSSGASESGVFQAQSGTQDASCEDEIVIPGLDPNATRSVEMSVFRGVEQTTLISWPPSNSGLRADETRDSNNSLSDSNRSFAAPSFLLDNTSDIPPATNTTTASRTSQLTGTQTQGPESQSFAAYSDASSVAHFPRFHFSLHALTPLGVLADAHQNHPAAAAKPKQTAGWHGPGGAPSQRHPAGPARNMKVNLLLAVLEVDGPDTVRLKRGADAGAQVAVLKLILGDEAGNVARLTAWRETAEAWADGGGAGEVEVKRGDIVHIENVTVTQSNASPGAPSDGGGATPSLSASPFLKSKLTICYRAMPTTPKDARLRPDLRVAISDPAVRRVAGVVEWFERMAGLG